jgi:hypothetical protein
LVWCSLFPKRAEEDARCKMQSRRKRVTAGPEGVLMMMQEANKQKGRGKGNTLLKAARGLYSPQHTWHDAEGRSPGGKQSPVAGSGHHAMPEATGNTGIRASGFWTGLAPTPHGRLATSRGSKAPHGRQSGHTMPQRAWLIFDVVITRVHMASEPWKHGDCSGNMERPSA